MKYNREKVNIEGKEKQETVIWPDYNNLFLRNHKLVWGSYIKYVYTICFYLNWVYKSCLGPVLLNLSMYLRTMGKNSFVKNKLQKKCFSIPRAIEIAFSKILHVLRI